MNDKKKSLIKLTQFTYQIMYYLFINNKNISLNNNIINYK